MVSSSSNAFLAVVPLLPSVWIVFNLYSYYAAAPAAAALLGTVFGSTVLSVLGWAMTSLLVPVIKRLTEKAGLFGKDLGKKGTEDGEVPVPEALGIVPGIVYLVCVICSQGWMHSAQGGNPSSELYMYNAAALAVCFMTFLGFMDDVLDLKWRYKLLLPSVASLPLLVAYTGPTSVRVPAPLNRLFMGEGGELTLLGMLVNLFCVVDTEADGHIIELGMWFLVYMGLLAVFCTNAINIYAGINGLEAGQTYIIACSVLCFKLHEVYTAAQVTADSSSSLSDAERLYGPDEAQRFALLMVLPFIGVTLGLLQHNWFPARVFVGDTFCYFGGMTFAVIGILGHFSKTLALLFLPQLVNFALSIPQLFKVIPCPRHRLPLFDSKTGLMSYSRFDCKPHEYRLFKRLYGLPADATHVPNYTLICLVLRVFGPMHERSLCLTLMTIQIVCSVLAFAVRYTWLEPAVSSLQ